MQALVSTRVVSGAWRSATRNQLRVVAYHEIGDARAFERQLQHLSAHYTPVSSTQVLRWLHESAPLPPHPVWVTFDDGVEDVVRVGLPLLQQYSVPATLFVCPALIDTDRLHWWQAVERAGSAGLLATSTGDVSRTMKAATDPDRRSAVAELELRLADTSSGAAGQQLTTENLRAWLAAGNDLGNHSFDHPRLDRCSADEQTMQVQATHDWLTGFLGRPPDVFAWPNGDPADAALERLRALDYRAVLLCDHRLSRRTPMALSRVRIDADDSVARLRSVVSGAHPAVFGVQQRVRSLLRRG